MEGIRKNKSRISLRPMSSLSLLPTKSYLNRNASLVIHDDLSFMAVRVFEEEDDYYELAWCSPEEIALMASLTIGTHPDYGKVHLFPASWFTFITDDDQDLSDSKIIESARIVLKERLSEVVKLGKLTTWDELPPCLSIRSYNFNQNVRLSHQYQSFLLESIDLQNHLLVRGLSHFLKSAMLKCLSRSFIDTACLEIYVALESTLQIILEKLRASGMHNPSNRDASNFLLEAFDEPYRLEKYYEQFYEDRIKAVHPSSRFGVAKFTPLYVDDLYMLYNDLLRNFEFLITNQPNCYTNYE